MKVRISNRRCFQRDALRGNQLAILPDGAGISTEGLKSRIQFR
jgi:hypothetical protein